MEKEESNLFLIQNNQETESQLEELKSQYKEMQASMERQTTSLQDNVRSLEAAIEDEERKTQALERKVVLGVHDREEERVLQELHGRIAQVFSECGGDLGSNPSRIAMLTRLEGRLEELLAAISAMPQDYVEEKERELEKIRRERVREERQQEQAHMMEVRLQKSLERSQAPVKKKLGKPVMERSAPPRKVVQTEKRDPVREQEIMDAKYILDEASAKMADRPSRSSTRGPE